MVKLKRSRRKSSSTPREAAAPSGAVPAAVRVVRRCISCRHNYFADRDFHSLSEGRCRTCFAALNGMNFNLGTIPVSASPPSAMLSSVSSTSSSSLSPHPVPSSLGDRGAPNANDADCRRSPSLVVEAPLTASVAQGSSSSSSPANNFSKAAGCVVVVPPTKPAVACVAEDELGLEADCSALSSSREAPLNKSPDHHPDLASSVTDSPAQQASGCSGATDEDILSASYSCFICGLPLPAKAGKSTSDQLAIRVNHIKSCGRRFGVKLSNFRDGKAAVLREVSNGPARGATNDINSALLAGAKKIKMEASKPRNVNAVLLAAAKVKVKEDSRPRPKKKTKYSRTSWSTKASENGKFQPPLYKKIKSTNLIVDGFHYAGNHCSTYFLTHFHSDHYGGIGKKWDHGTIYCSPVTAALVVQQLRVDPKYVRAIALDSPFTVVSPDCLGLDVSVTLVDANHCPGAILFYFTIRNPKLPKMPPRTCLHVGDFRWNRSFMQNLGPIRKIMLRKVRLNELYLDTTYCDPKYNFPTQEEAINAALRCAEIERVDKNETLFVFGAYTIGKEKIFLAVAKKFSKKVFVDQRRAGILRTYLSEEEAKIITTDKSATNLWVSYLGNVVNKGLHEMLQESKKMKSCFYKRVVGFRPSGWTFEGAKQGQADARATTQMTLNGSEVPKPPPIVTCTKSGAVSIYGIPYSEHSSFSELVDCLLCLRPENIIPTVNAANSRAQVDALVSSCRETVQREVQEGVHEQESKRRSLASVTNR